MIQRFAITVAWAAGIVHAVVNTTSIPQVTHTPLLPRADFRTLGWYSDGVERTPWQYDSAATTFSTSYTYFRQCANGGECIMYTSCSAGYLVGNGTSSFCGSGEFCSHHILYHSSVDPNPYSWFWGFPAFDGLWLYEISPTAPANVAATVTTSKTVTAPPSTDSSTHDHAGLIAGSVVGGLVVLSTIGGLGSLILHRVRRNAVKPVLDTQFSYNYVGQSGDGGFRETADNGARGELSNNGTTGELSNNGTTGELSDNRNVGDLSGHRDPGELPPPREMSELPATGQ